MQQKKCTKIPGILPQVVAIVCVRIKSIGEVDETISSEVRFGNNREVPVKEKGKISIKLKNGELNWIGAVFMSQGSTKASLVLGSCQRRDIKPRLTRNCVVFMIEKGLH